MTKLIEWMLGLNLFLGIWFSLIFYPSSILEKWQSIILFLPLILIFIFGFLSLTIVLWRTYNFNDCKEAAHELQKEIEHARVDLKKKGFNF